MGKTKIRNEFEVIDNCPLCGAIVITKNQYNPPRVESRGGKPHQKRRCDELRAKNLRALDREEKEVLQLEFFNDAVNALKVVTHTRIQDERFFYYRAKEIFAGSRKQKGAYKGQG